MMLQLCVGAGGAENTISNPREEEHRVKINRIFTFHPFCNTLNVI